MMAAWTKAAAGAVIISGQSEVFKGEMCLGFISSYYYPHAASGETKAQGGICLDQMRACKRNGEA